MEKNSNHYYFLGGIVIDSELSLPGLQTLPAQTADVSIRLGTATLHALKRDACEIESGCLATLDEYYHTFPGLVIFHILRGDEIVVQPLDFSRLPEVISLLHSVIFAILFYRRGMLPLHASAVASDGQIFGFLGRSGVGKSTLAARLNHRGYQVTSDDLLLLKSTGQDVIKVIPCAPWLRLWEDAFDGIGKQIVGLEPIAGKESKYMVPLPPGEPGEALPLAALFILESNSDSETRFTRLSPAAAVVKLMLYVYPILLIHKLGQNADLFRQCRGIAEHVAIFTFSRPWDAARFDPVLDKLEAKFSDIAMKTRRQPASGEST